MSEFRRTGIMKELLMSAIRFGMGSALLVCAVASGNST